MIGNALTERYSVSPQISPQDVAAIAEAGFGTVVCNRPDAEVPPGLQAADIKAAVEAAGLRFVENPFSHAAFDMGLVDRQEAALSEAGDGSVFAYCASGNRSSVLWAMAMARSGTLTPEDIVDRAAGAGYDLRGLMPQLAALSGAQ